METLVLEKDEKERDNKERFVKFLNRGRPPYEKLMLRDYPRIRAILQGKIVPPQQVEIQPSSACNLRCKFCFGRDYKRLPKRMGKKEIQEIARKIDEFQEDEFEIGTVNFCGTTGDPLVSPVTVEGIRLFKGLGKKVVVYTNGLALDEKIDGHPYYDHLVGIDRLNLSLDAGSEETFERLKGCKGFERVIRSLERLLEKRVDNTHPRIEVSYVIGRENYEEIVSTSKLIGDIGADCIRFRVDFTDVEGVRRVSDRIVDNLREAREYSNSDFEVISIYSEDDIRKDDSAFHSSGRKCFTSCIWACIGPNCELYACGHRAHGKVESYGSLLNNSFRELWASKVRQDSVRGLPDQHCTVCSPFSLRANEFMTFLSQLQLEEVDKLHDKYFGKEQ